MRKHSMLHPWHQNKQKRHTVGTQRAAVIVTFDVAKQQGGLLEAALPALHTMHLPAYMYRVAFDMAWTAQRQSES